MQSPIVHGARRTQSTYADSASPASQLSLSSSSSPSTQSSTASPASSEPPANWSHALLESPIAADLIVLSPHKRKADVFPTDLPPKVIRHAMAEGFAFDDIIAVLCVALCRCVWKLDSALLTVFLSRLCAYLYL